MPKLTVYSPFDRSEMESLELNDAGDVENMLKRAQHLFEGKPLSPDKRAEILNTTATALASQKETFALTIAKEGGKPLQDAQVEVDRAVLGIRNAIEEMNRMAGTEIPMGLNPACTQRLAFTTKEPIGIVVAISAFNHPLNLTIHQVVPAIATGCPVIIKPGQTTPLSCINFVKLLHQAGLPEEWCQVAILENDLAEKLATDSRIAFFSFIGSSKVGWYLRSKLAPGVRCALEHGGAAPVIVEKDANLERMVPALIKGGYYHAGQVCVSVQRVFAHEAIADNLIGALSEQIKTLKVGDPIKIETDVGPLILPREVDRVANWVNEAEKEGAQRISGGQKISETCYAPTLLTQVPTTSKVFSQEIFGPVVGIRTFTDFRNAVIEANALPLAFQASIFSQDVDKALGIAKALDASTVMLNDHTAFRVDWMPFGGRKTSGLGVGGIPYTMHDMTQEKMIVLRSKEL